MDITNTILGGLDQKFSSLTLGLTNQGQWHEDDAFNMIMSDVYLSWVQQVIAKSLIFIPDMRWWSIHHLDGGSSKSCAIQYSAQTTIVSFRDIVMHTTIGTPHGRALAHPGCNGLHGPCMLVEREPIINVGRNGSFHL